MQEAWLRLSRSDADAVANLGGWLTTVVARVCLDMLRARRARREDLVADLAARAAPQHRRGRRPGPPGRARRLGRPRAAGRARHAHPRRAPGVRAARHVRRAVRRGRADRRAHPRRRAPARQPRAPRCAARRRRPIPTSRRQRKVVAAFLAAARAGDFDALLAVLDPDVVLPRRRRARPARPAAGGRRAGGGARAADRAPRASRRSRGRRWSTAPRGSVLGPAERPAAVVGFTVADGRIAAIDLIVDREKLGRALRG